ncbi:MAG TPA: hypothetical protein VFG14_16620, partial [Chthoniobacteraceae bacterium]|nr:hypothetical protein [Chthoniobacteraceae bacterium]
LSTADFVRVSANGAFNPFGEGFFSAYPFHRFEVKEPGTYRVRFVYSTTNTELKRYAGWPGGQPMDDIIQLFKRVSHVHLTSNELKVRFEARPQ